MLLNLYALPFGLLAELSAFHVILFSVYLVVNTLPYLGRGGGQILMKAILYTNFFFN